jgi:hypothetical protein
MVDTPIRVFVGCDPNDCDLEQMMVLEHSLRKRASLPVEIEWMQLSRDPSSFWYSSPGDAPAGWRTERWATPFSGFRWAVPARCGFEGRAIYMDTDMIVLGDIADLWRSPIDAPAILSCRTDTGMNRYGVMLWDCAAARSTLPDLERLRSRPESHRELCRRFVAETASVQPLDSAFNNIDGDGATIEQIEVLHYSDMGTQFSHTRSLERLEAEQRQHWFDGAVLDHPRADLKALFENEYAEALAAGRSLEDYRASLRFGAFPKKTERRYKGNAYTRGPRSWWRSLFR